MPTIYRIDRGARLQYLGSSWNLFPSNPASCARFTWPSTADNRDRQECLSSDILVGRSSLRSSLPPYPPASFTLALGRSATIPNVQAAHPISILPTPTHRVLQPISHCKRPQVRSRHQGCSPPRPGNTRNTNQLSLELPTASHTILVITPRCLPAPQSSENPAGERADIS